MAVKMNVCPSRQTIAYAGTEANDRSGRCVETRSKPRGTQGRCWRVGEVEEREMAFH